MHMWLGAEQTRIAGWVDAYYSVFQLTSNLRFVVLVWNLATPRHKNEKRFYCEQCVCNFLGKHLQCSIYSTHNIKRTIVLSQVLAKVPCSHVVDLAKAEVRENPLASEAVKAFAAVSLSDAEAGCHRLFKQLGLCAPVTVNFFESAELRDVPYVNLSCWVQWLLDTNRLWRQLVGVCSWERMQVVLEEFWARYKELFPGHEVFTLGLDLKRVIPFYSHTDEGRTYKSKPIWILSCHGCLGRGTHHYIRKQKHLAPLRRLQMGLNFVGNTWATHFVFTTVVRQILSQTAIDMVTSTFAADCEVLIRQGVQSSDGSKHVYLLHLGSKGDLPALAKLANFTRTFSHVPRQSSSRTPATGICPHCLAGQESDGHLRLAYPYEDVSNRPGWLITMETVDPWLSEPKILANLPIDRSYRSQFFETDVWHNLHLGIMKHWLGSGFVSILERMHIGPLQGSVEAKFDWLTTDFKLFCRQKRISPYIAEISRATLTFPQSGSCPVGAWSKGAVSTHFCQYLENFCDRWIDERFDDQVLQSIVTRLGLACCPFFFFVFKCSCFQVKISTLCLSSL